MKQGKAFLYIALLPLFYLSLEHLGSKNIKELSLLSNKVLFKVEHLKRSKADVAFLGSSQTLDAVDVFLMNKSFKNKKTSTTVFNSSNTGANFSQTKYAFSEIVKIKNTKHVFVEATRHMFQKGKFTLPELEKVSIAGNDLESKLRNEYQNKSSLYKLRKLFRPNSMLKLVILWTSNLIDPDTWFRSRTLKQIFFHPDPPAQYSNKWQSRSFLAKQDIVNVSYSKKESALEDIINLARKNNIRLSWIFPPSLAVSTDEPHCSRDFKKSLRSLSQRYQFNVYDYACKKYEKKYFRDSTHLNIRGRKLFTKVLFEEIYLDLERAAN